MGKRANKPLDGRTYWNKRRIAKRLQLARAYPSRLLTYEQRELRPILADALIDREIIVAEHQGSKGEQTLPPEHATKTNLICRLFAILEGRTVRTVERDREEPISEFSHGALTKEERAYAAYLERWEDGEERGPYCKKPYTLEEFLNDPFCYARNSDADDDNGFPKPGSIPVDRIAPEPERDDALTKYLSAMGCTKPAPIEQGTRDDESKPDAPTPSLPDPTIFDTMFGK